MHFLTINNTNIENIESNFEKIAKSLFNDFKINVNNQSYK